MAESSIQRLKERLSKLLHQKDLAALKAKMLEDQSARDREREDMMTQVVQQLMDRQREMNIMLNRANLMLNRAQETNAILSLEFSELIHALPAPENPEVKDRIHRINNLFRKTGAEDAQTVAQEPTAESVIVTPPPGSVTGEPGEVIEEIPVEPAYAEQEEVAEEAEAVNHTGAQSLEELFRRTGDEWAAPMPSETAQAAEETPIFDEEAVVEPVEDIEAQPEPVAGRERRWWQLLGRR